MAARRMLLYLPMAWLTLWRCLTLWQMQAMQPSPAQCQMALLQKSLNNSGGWSSRGWNSRNGSDRRERDWSGSVRKERDWIERDKLLQSLFLQLHHWPLEAPLLHLPLLHPLVLLRLFPSLPHRGHLPQDLRRPHPCLLQEEEEEEVAVMVEDLEGAWRLP